MRVWRQQSYIRDILGSYEGRYFRHCMALLRRRHGEVVFIVASDDVAWARAELVTAAHNDTFLSADFVPDNTSKSAKETYAFTFECRIEPLSLLIASVLKIALSVKACWTAARWVWTWRC